MKKMKNVLLAILAITAVNLLNATVLLGGVVCLSSYINNDVLFMFCTMFFMVTYGAVSCYEVIKIEGFFKNRQKNE